jgi:hypothetical protein
MRKGFARTCLALSIVALAAGPAFAGTEAPRSEKTLKDAGLEFLSLLATIPYGAAKIGYAITGATVGGLEYAWSEGQSQPAQEIWESSMRGTYIITPEHLKGEEPIKFFGDISPTPQPSK